MALQDIVDWSRDWAGAGDIEKYSFLADEPLMSGEEFGERFPYSSVPYGRYESLWEGANTQLAPPRAGGGGSLGSLFSLALGGGQSFWEGMPPAIREAIEDYFPWSLEHMRELQERELPEYPGGFGIAAPEGEQYSLDMMRRRLEEGGGLAGEAFKGAWEAYLPQFRRSWEETVQKPAQERLEAIGLGGSTPGMEFLSVRGEEQAIREAGLRKDVDIGRAEALRQESAIEAGNIEAYWNMLARPEERSRREQERALQHWYMQQRQPIETAGVLGVPTTGLAGGMFSDIYRAGGGIGAGLIGADISRATSMYGTDMQKYLMEREFQLMQPYLEQAAQPVPISGGSTGCCVIASVVNGDRYAYPVQVCRKYRNDYMSLAEQRGYYIFAEAVVPLMLRYKLAMNLARRMVNRLVETLAFRLGGKKSPRILSRVMTSGLFILWGTLGKLRQKFTRSNGETVEQSIRRHVKNLKNKVYQNMGE